MTRDTVLRESREGFTRGKQAGFAWPAFVERMTIAEDVDHALEIVDRVIRHCA